MANAPLRVLRSVACALSLLGGLGTARAAAEDGWFKSYEARLATTLAQQPRWAAPLITTAPRLEDGFRTDFVRQTTAGGQTSWSYGNTKGMQIVPFRRVELRFSPPPFQTHTDPHTEDGFGDVAFRLKYRVYASNEQHRNAIVAVLLGASLPTGKSGNGSCCAILSPTLELGKGFGKLALTTSAGGSLPVSNTEKLGRQIAWNNAVQYRAMRLLWVETEFNSTFYLGGKNDGRQQTFATPGVIVSRIALTHAGAAGVALTLGIGEQIALTHFNTYNHSPIFTARVRF